MGGLGAHNGRWKVLQYRRREHESLQRAKYLSSTDKSTITEVEDILDVCENDLDRKDTFIGGIASYNVFKGFVACGND